MSSLRQRAENPQEHPSFLVRWTQDRDFLTPSRSCCRMRRASPSSRRFRRFTYEHRFPPSAYSITRWILLELSAFGQTKNKGC